MMVPAIVGLLLWPRRWRPNEKKVGKDIQSHRVSTASSSSSEEDEKAETPAKSSFKKCFTRRSSVKSKGTKEPELQLVCYLCGQHFARSRLLDHVPDCLKAWNRREEIKPKDERAPLPTRPVELDQELPTSFETAEMFNKLMRCAWLGAINRRCEFCKKTFKTGAYIRHIKICQIEHRDSVDDAVLERRASDVVSRKPQRTRRRSQIESQQAFRRSMEDPARIRKRAEALKTAPVYGAQSMDDSPGRFSRYRTTDLPQREETAVSASSKTLNGPKRNADTVRRAERSRSFTGNRPMTAHSAEDPLPKYKPYSSCQEDRHGRRPAAPSRPSDPFAERRRSTVRTVTLIKETSVEEEIRPPKTEVHKSDPFRRAVVHSFKESASKETRHDTRGTLKKSQSSNRAAVPSWMHSTTPSGMLPVSMNRAKEMHTPKEKENTSTLAAKTTSSTRKYMRRWSISEAESIKDVKSEHRDSSTRVLDKSISLATRGPRGYTCYLCGRQFGSASLGIHLRQCRQLWEDQEALKRRKRDRRPLPTPPPELDDPLPTEREAIDAFNNIMLEIYEKRSLMSCPHCGRTFIEEAFEKHQRICTAENPGGPLGPSKYHPVSIPMNTSSSSKPKEAIVSDIRPAQYCCYLCGRQYGSQSLLLHVPRCQKLWMDREATKPKKERRSLPPPPPEYEGFPHMTLPTEAEAVLEFNNAVYAYWDRMSLCVCAKCGRSFNEESYAKHQRLCQGAVPIAQTGHLKKLPSKNDSKYSSESSDNDASKTSSKHHFCHLCGKKYEINSLLVHVPRCEKRWLQEEEHKPKEQQRSLPPRPEQLVSYFSVSDVGRDTASSS